MRVLTMDGLAYYHQKLTKYIDEKINENKVIILKECPTCGGHEFNISNNTYECTHCGNKYYYQKIGDILSLEKIITDTEKENV